MHRRLSRAWARGAAWLARACFFGVPNRREQTVPLTITRAQRDATLSVLSTRGDSPVPDSRTPAASAALLGCWPLLPRGTGRHKP
jgi:hypothetical protein